MKKFRIFLIALALLQVVALLGGCGGDKDTSKSGYTKVEGSSCDSVVAELEERGVIAAVISVYEPEEENGAVFVGANYESAEKGDCVTVAVNDHSFKEQVYAMLLAPRYFKASAYEELQGGLENEEDKKFMGIFYNLVEDMVYLEPSISNKEREAITEIIKECGYTHEDMLADYIELGFIPTLNSIIEAEVLDKSNCRYTSNDEGITITATNVVSGNVVIPAEIDSKPVTEVDISGGYGPGNFLHSIYIGENITRLSGVGNSFSLRRISGGNARMDISYAFGGASEYVVDKADGVRMLDCLLYRYEGAAEEFAVPENITLIANEAFANTTVKAVKLHEKIKSIGFNVFSECTALEEIHIDSIESWCTKYVGGRTFYENTVLYVNEKPCTKIELPEGLTEISANLFCGYSKLESIIIPDSVTKIGRNAFWSCTSLSKVEGGKNVCVIDGSAFDGTPWIGSISKDAKDGFAFFGDGVLMDYSGTNAELILPDSVKYIYSSAFAYNTYVKSLTINSGITYGENGFAADFNASLEKLYLPESITKFEYMSVPWHQEANEETGAEYIEGTTIYCTAGSEAEQYAMSRNIPYVIVD